MATLTTNLFRGQGEADHRLRVVHGRWPDDVDGAVVVVGPDKRRPGGHWFTEPGLLQRIHLRPDAEGAIVVQHRRVPTRADRLRRRLPRLVPRVGPMELSPLGVSNLANTNVTWIRDRLVLGYDAGRPVEVDPVTLQHLGPVGSAREWLQAAPGTAEPLCAVAAHHGADHDRGVLWFVNTALVAAPGRPRETWVARWDLEGPVHRWRVRTDTPYDSIHDVGVSCHHVVFSDLPFVVEPATFVGGRRRTRNQTHGRLWIVPTAAAEAAPPGSDVRAVEVRLPLPVGHFDLDVEERGGLLRIVVQHVVLSDLTLSVGSGDLNHRGDRFDPDHEGLIPLAVQPSVVGRYLVDPADGRVVESELLHDDGVWGGLLATADLTRPASRRRRHNIWYAGVGFDPEAVPRSWWDLYADAPDAVVAPRELPDDVRPGTLARVDVESMKYGEVWEYPPGDFPSPPTFVPRRGSDEPDDGYVVVVVHRDGPKAVEIFDAGDLAAGPVARATAQGFNPNLLLHSTWVPERVGPRRSRYRVRRRDDLLGAVAGAPRAVGRVLAAGRPPARSHREVSS